eukprot:COSAG01_NODE_5303_length_4350_cov_14.343213_5_plen_72_part_00
MLRVPNPIFPSRRGWLPRPTDKPAGTFAITTNSPPPPCHTYDTRNYTMEGAAAVHFIVNMGARNGFFIVGM